MMFWDGIINSTLVGPFFVKEGVKMNKNIRQLANFMQWFNNKSKTFKNKMIFMHDNAPSHATPRSELLRHLRRGRNIALRRHMRTISYQIIEKRLFYQIIMISLTIA